VLIDDARSPQAALDAAIPDLDWTVLPDGAVRSGFEAPSGTLAMVSLGDPTHPRVVLVPGVTGSKEDFSLMLPILAAAGYFVQSYDQSGQYESAEAGPQHRHPPQEHYDYDLFVDDLIAVLESAGPAAPSHVLGYSFAGTVAQLAMVRRPELFASLALLSCPPEPGQGFRGVKRIGWISGLTTGGVGAALMMWGIRRNFVPVPPGRLRFVRDRLTVTDRGSVRDIIRMMKRAPDLREEVKAIDVPKLIAVGAHDLWPLRLHEGFARRIGAQIAVYRSGHSPCETSPHQLSRDLVELYSRAAGR
jgi:pimeloyl-ACP methyl ester carboxylesterase